MKNCFFILFAGVVLPAYGQGVFFNNENTIKSKSIYTYNDNAQPAGHFVWRPQPNAKVKQAAVMSGDQTLYTIAFDQQGRMKSCSSAAVNPAYTVKIDSFFGSNTTIVAKTVYDKAGVVSIDSVVITYHEYQDEQVNIAFYRTESLAYKYGRYINQRNTSYNERYFNNAPEVHVYSRFLPVDWPQTYATQYNVCEPMDRFWKKKYKEDKLYLCRRSAEITGLVTKRNSDGRPMTRKQVQTHPFVRKYGKMLPLQYYVEAEAFEPPICMQLIEMNNSLPFSKVAYAVNAAGLNEAIYEDSYPRETGKVSIKPLDPECDFYLKGRSGVPDRKTLYTIRYEYYD